MDEILWGRFLVGLGIGVNTVLVPVYISEVLYFHCPTFTDSICLAPRFFMLFTRVGQFKGVEEVRGRNWDFSLYPFLRI